MCTYVLIFRQMCDKYHNQIQYHAIMLIIYFAAYIDTLDLMRLTCNFHIDLLHCIFAILAEHISRYHHSTRYD
jgi:hypothetical protein